MCICLFGQGYEKAVSAVAVHSLPVSNTITTYAQLRDALLGRGFFGRESTGLVILPYSVGALAAKSEFGLAVFGADGTSAEAALSEVTGYLAPRRAGPASPGFSPGHSPDLAGPDAGRPGNPPGAWVTHVTLTVQSLRASRPYSVPASK